MSHPPRKIRVGIIGVGKISDQYFKGLSAYPLLEVIACADLDLDRAKAKAAEQNIRGSTVDELLAAPDIDLIVNLTIPVAHVAVNRAILLAGKHVYCEKPFALSSDEGQSILDLARELGLLVGCAPDTFLGGGVQTTIAAINRGEIGRPLSALAFCVYRGPENWHPRPEFYYQPGGGPMFDMGPYYITAMVNFFGPARFVTAVTKRAFSEREIRKENTLIRTIPVEVNTHYSTTIEFASGVVATVVMSFDSWLYPRFPNCIIYGTDYAISASDPNNFDGVTRKYARNVDEYTELPYTHTTERGRGSGVADMAYSILRRERRFRASGALANHVLEIMEAADRSGETGQRITLKTTCEKPEPLPSNLAASEFDP